MYKITFSLPCKSLTYSISAPVRIKLRAVNIYPQVHFVACWWRDLAVEQQSFWVGS